MQLDRLLEIPGTECVLAGPADAAITGAFTSDLLSDVLARAAEDSVLITIQAHLNAVAVASLADVAVIVLCEGAKLDEDARARAQKEGVNIVTTEKPAFDAALAIAKAAGLLGR